ncbi:MAG: glycosyltransferase family 4 protein [Rickettsiales bacterium]|nr:glycosyltransferase family 4 protein [Rickettsiales bacterium]
MNEKRIINAMFAKGLGGIEQAFVDYTQALLLQGYDVICVVSKGAKIIKELQDFRISELQKNLSEVPKFQNSGVQIIEISQLGKWDFIAKIKLYNLIKKEKPIAVIAHGNRPTSLLRWACTKTKTILVSVAHNYKIKPLLSADYIFSITQNLKNYIGGSRFPLNKIFVIPNMLKVDGSWLMVDRKNHQLSTINHKPTIGVMARFVKKKGVDIFLRACGALKDKGYKFNAIIGGIGEEQFALQAIRDELKLNDYVKFIGWVKDKEEFYNSIDIFCLPSLHEPFGIVILEAFSYKKPIVTTNSEGPEEICENEIDCIMVEKNHSGKLAEALAKLLDDKELANKIAENGYNKLIANYSLEKVSIELDKALKVVIG